MTDVLTSENPRATQSAVGSIDGLDSSVALNHKPRSGSDLLHSMPSGYLYGFWAIGRPMTKTWGSGAVWKRLCASIGEPDVAFGKTDGIPEHVFAVDRKGGYEWRELPFGDNQFQFGYWDPPYDKLYKPECREIWRVCRKVAVLHTHCYPTSWMVGAKRVAGVAITMGPLKQIRFLQIFEKHNGAVAPATEESNGELMDGAN